MINFKIDKIGLIRKPTSKKYHTYIKNQYKEFVPFFDKEKFNLVLKILIPILGAFIIMIFRFPIEYAFTPLLAIAIPGLCMGIYEGAKSKKQPKVLAKLIIKSGDKLLNLIKKYIMQKAMVAAKDEINIDTALIENYESYMDMKNMVVNLSNTKVFDQPKLFDDTCFDSDDKEHKPSFGITNCELLVNDDICDPWKTQKCEAGVKKILITLLEKTIVLVHLKNKQMTLLRILNSAVNKLPYETRLKILRLYIDIVDATTMEEAKNEFNKLLLLSYKLNIKKVVKTIEHLFYTTDQLMKYKELFFQEYAIEEQEDEKQIIIKHKNNNVDNK